MITVALTTLRVDPRFDLFADSLAPQITLCGIPVEVLVVDGQLWYQHDRREQLARAVDKRFAYRHIAPKPTRWQGPRRVTSMDYWDACSARNTAFIYAEGQQVVFVDDCMILGDGFLKAHILARQQSIGLAGRYQSVRNEEFDTTGLDMDCRWNEGEPGRLVPGAHLFGMNMSVPLAAAVEVNGYDEYFSGQGGSEDCTFGVRIERARCPIWYEPECVVYQVMNTHESVCGYAGGDSQHTGRKPALKPKELVLKADGIPHFANEKLVERLNEEPGRIQPWGLEHGYQLPLSISRVWVREGRELPLLPWPTHDWRDGQPLEEM